MRQEASEPETWRAVVAAFGETSVAGGMFDAVNFAGTVMLATPVATAVLIDASRRLRRRRRSPGPRLPGARARQLIPA